MKTFKTLEELIEFVNQRENIEVLANGEIALKDCHEDFRALEKSRKDYGLSTNDKKTLRRQKEELSLRVAELTEQLDSVNNELAGLKEVHMGSNKDTLQKLIREKSELLAKNKSAESKIKDLEQRVSTIPDLERKVETFKEASYRSHILDAARKAAAARKVPQHIIDDPDFEWIVAHDFTIDETGRICTKGDYPQSMDDYIAAKQRDRSHWMPISQGGVSVASMQPISKYPDVSDDLAAVAALFG